ncbi:FtsZ-binding cell division protein ZapB [Shinella sp. BE166]|uniref:portal protein n=1 Tax=Shinella sp. BE166 TaxID=3373918 RepID=UPI003EB88393
MAEDKMSERLSAGKKAFQRCSDADSHNRLTALDDIKFSRLEEQWPDKMVKQREMEGRPCLTISKMNAFIRQVVNDARQNKPSIKVHPVDSGADVATADVINGLIRNIEYTSNADVAYDTAIEQSVAGGFGYWRVGLDYAYDDAFEMDLSIERIANQFSVYGDPDSMSADSCDWNDAFVVDRIPREEFKSRYKGKTNINGGQVDVDFDSDAWSEAWSEDQKCAEDGGVLIAEWWHREEVEREIFKLSDGRVVSKEEMAADENLATALEVGAIQVVTSRKAKSHKVTQTIMSGADVLEERVWPGRYIPIIPVYGDEIVVEGKRYFRSLIHSAKDAQRMFNYWRTTSTELVALAPRVPFIGEEGAFAVDEDKWSSVNTKSWSHIEFAKGKAPPQRQPLDGGVAAGALQEALNAADDMKAIIGLYDASLGARSNETSGKAIMARQREGDVATFHFIDNLARAIRHTGRVLIDLIPKVYTSERVVRVIGEDGTPDEKQINKPFPQQDESGQPVMQEEQDEYGQKIQTAVMAMHDLTVGKYDLTVTTGPSYTTRREEAAAQMVEFVRSYPDSAPLIGDLVAKNLDWPGADEIAKRLQSVNPALQKEQVPPELQQQVQQGMELIQKLQREVESLKADKSIDQFNAETNRMKVVGDMKLDEQKQRFDAAKTVDAGTRSDWQFERQQQNPARQG